MTQYLDFEKPLAEIEGKAEELRAIAEKSEEEMDVAEEAAALDAKAAKMLEDLYKSLTPWRKCQVARHPERPHCQTYIDALFTEYTPLAGDRNFADDHAVMGGLARFEDRPVMVIGHEKGHDTKTRIERNFGMARPEGYRLTPLFIDDLIDVLVWALEQGCNETLNVGGDEHMTIAALTRSMAAHLHEPLAFLDVDEPAASLAASSARLNERYAERLRTSWADGLAKTWD